MKIMKTNNFANLIDLPKSNLGLTWWTFAFSALWITFSTILAFAFLFALRSVLSIWARFITEWSSEAGCAITFTRNVMAGSTVLTATHFQTVQAIPVDRALELAFFTSETLETLAYPVELVTNGIILAIAFL